MSQLHSSCFASCNTFAPLTQTLAQPMSTCSLCVGALVPKWSPLEAHPCRRTELGCGTLPRSRGAAWCRVLRASLNPLFALLRLKKDFFLRGKCVKLYERARVRNLHSAQPFNHPRQHSNDHGMLLHVLRKRGGEQKIVRQRTAPVRQNGRRPVRQRQRHPRRCDAGRGDEGGACQRLRGRDRVPRGRSRSAFRTRRQSLCHSRRVRSSARCRLASACVLDEECERIERRTYPRYIVEGLHRAALRTVFPKILLSPGL